jgi:hypothetical protein
MSQPLGGLEPETRALIQALTAVNGKVPEVGLALLEGRLSIDQQRTFAALLDQLAELLRAHADAENGKADDAAVIVPGEVMPPAGARDARSAEPVDGYPDEYSTSPQRAAPDDPP